MMRNSLIIAAVALFIAGQNVPAQLATLKIGVINSDKILDRYSGTKTAEEKLKAAMAKWQGEIEKRENEIKALQNTLEKQRDLLSAEARKNLMDSLTQKYQDYQKFAQEKQNEALTKRAEVLKPVLDTINTIIEKIAKEEYYDIIFDARGAVVYTAPKLEMTDRIISLFPGSMKDRLESGEGKKGAKKDAGAAKSSK
jgi:outer membrane protein